MTDAVSRAQAARNATEATAQRAREEMAAKAQHQRGQTPRAGKH
jgi:hypothetical protein